ncbi:hypothetical protein EDB84DRAFT_1436949 [Lactarius hengduanensis]|nr:hypothetical protein EDB84DRAFT_1436949 [Lactarius hengduanensis]
MLSAIESLHTRHYVHRDIKPDNFMVRAGRPHAAVFLIDFGLARLFCNPATYLHIPYSNDHSIVGTLPFTSINGQQGHAQSRRDDLESLIYTIIFSACVNQKAVLQKKKLVTAEELCKGLHTPFCNFVTYVCSLGFDEKPDYQYLHSILSRCSAAEADHPGKALPFPTLLLSVQAMNLFPVTGSALLESGHNHLTGPRCLRPTLIDPQQPMLRPHPGLPHLLTTVVASITQSDAAILHSHTAVHHSHTAFHFSIRFNWLPYPLVCPPKEIDSHVSPSDHFVVWLVPQVLCLRHPLVSTGDDALPLAQLATPRHWGRVTSSTHAHDKARVIERLKVCVSREWLAAIRRPLLRATDAVENDRGRVSHGQGVLDVDVCFYGGVVCSTVKVARLGGCTSERNWGHVTSSTHAHDKARAAIVLCPPMAFLPLVHRPPVLCLDHLVPSSSEVSALNNLDVIERLEVCVSREWLATVRRPLLQATDAVENDWGRLDGEGCQTGRLHIGAKQYPTLLRSLALSRAFPLSLIVRGNPGVCRGYPYPYPAKPVPVTCGYGFSRVLDAGFDGYCGVQTRAGSPRFRQ